MINEHAAFGEYLKAMRASHGYSLRHVARLTGLAPSTIKRIEDHTYSTPTPEALLALADALDLPAGVLAGFIDSYQRLIHASLPNLADYLHIKYQMKRNHITELKRHAEKLGYTP